MSKVVTNAKHPVAAFFHLLFKVRLGPCLANIGVGD
jgi:hypothetical protein